MEKDSVYTVKEVAVVLKVSLKTVYRLIEDGDLPAYQIKKTYRINRKDLEEYLKRSKTK